MIMRMLYARRVWVVCVPNDGSKTMQSKKATNAHHAWSCRPTPSGAHSPVTAPAHTQHRGTEGSHSSMHAALQYTPDTPRRYSGCRHCTRQWVHMGMQAAWRTVPSGDWIIMGGGGFMESEPS